MDALRSAKVLLGISGSIAAYKAPLIVRLLRQARAQVRVAMTPAAKQFVSPLVLANLSGETVACDMFEDAVQEGGSWHIHWAHWADVMLIAPCSAHLLASLAVGLCDSVVACLALALPRTTPLLIAPAMDTTMWLHPATQRNAEQLRRDGAIVIPPEEGELASGLWGVGRMPEPEQLVERVAHALQQRATSGDPVASSDRAAELLSKPLRPLDEAVASDRLTAEIEFARLTSPMRRLDGKTVLVTAGPTREPLDAVRFLSNRSSGKMGYAIAEAARDRGARVVLISGPVHLDPPPGVELVRVESAQQMLEAVQRYRWDIAIAAAAVADFAPRDTLPGKLKKHELGETLTIELVRTPDILAELGRSKRSPQVLVGFALEERARLEEGIEKLRSKGCDVIVLNAFDAPQSGFESDWNTITVVSFQNGELQRHAYEPAPKRICAERILEHAIEVYLQRVGVA